MTIPIILLAIHFIADFILQSDWMAINKSKVWSALLCHVVIYSLCFVLWGWLFVAITFATHFLTDAITSRITSYLWQKEQRHWFFAMIGLDQLIHYTTLALTFRYIYGR